MFANLIATTKVVLMKLGLIRQINSVTQFSAVQESEEQYNRIEAWKALYRGYLGEYEGVPFHDTYWTDAQGVRHNRRRASMKMAKVLAEEMASLVFNEKCAINVSSTGKKSNAPDPIADLIKKIFKDNRFEKRFQNNLEFGFAMGGFVIKPYYDDGIKITFVTADSFLPTQTTNDEIQAGVFVNETRKGDKYYTLLEWHDWEGDTYVITNELYQSTTANNLGTKVPLSVLYPDLDKTVTIEGLTHPLFVYIKPNIANNFETDSPLGISIYANAIDTLKSLDIAFDSFQREFKLGKRRIMVPHTAIRTVVDPETGDLRRYFDVNDEAYISYASASDDAKIEQMADNLRVEEHISAINALLNILASQTGFSAGTFAFTGGATVQTATQVISENSQTFRTKNSHETLIEEGIKELIDVILQLLVLYGELKEVPDIEVTVDFDDSIAEDRQANATYYSGLVSQGLMPKVRAIMRIFDLPEEEARKWLEEIKAEQSTVTPEMVDLFGTNTNNNQGAGA
jgi:A118 family predicted phage portal protein